MNSHKGAHKYALAIALTAVAATSFIFWFQTASESKHDQHQDDTPMLPAADAPPKMEASPETGAPSGSETSRVAAPSVPANNSLTPGDSDGADMERSAFHHQIQVTHLSTFMTEEPDIVAWNGYLGLLATTAQLDRGSVHESSEGLTGTFFVPEAGLSIDFTMTDEGYTIQSRSTAPLPGAGPTEFSSSLSFLAAGDEIKRAYGVVQFYPDETQSFYESGPVGYAYGTDAAKVFYRPLHGVMKDGGQYWLEIPPESQDKTIQVSDLAPAYGWLSRLEEVRRGRLSEEAK